MDKYTLTNEQVLAIFSLLYEINLETLKRTGEITPSWQSGYHKLSLKDGRVIENMFYDDKFIEICDTVSE